MNSPFYKIYTESGEDITDMVSSLRYEDCLKEDDLVIIQINNATNEIVDKKEFNSGSKIIFIYGLIGGKQSGKRYCTIIEPDVVYDSNISINLKCRDNGFFAKKLTSNYIWKNKKASDIAKQIAESLGMDYDIEESNIVYESYSQGNKSFAQLLKELASKEGSSQEDTKGNYEYYSRGNTLYFKRRDLSGNSVRTLTYKNGNGVLIKFHPKIKQNESSPESSVINSGIDLDTGKSFSVSATADTNKETTLGVKKVLVDAYDNVKQLPNTIKEFSSGKTTALSANNKDTAQKQVSGLHKSKSIGILEADIELEFEPGYEAGDVITINGVAQKHIGNWRIEKLVYTIQGGSNSLSATVVKNGSKTSNSNTSKSSTSNVNTTVGSSDSKSNSKEIKSKTVKVDAYNNIL